MAEQVDSLADRISHTLNEVRWRAIKSLEFKLKTNLLAPAVVAHSEKIVRSLVAELKMAKEDNLVTLMSIFNELSLVFYSK